MASTETDPWDWTLEEVVHNFCKSTELWSGRPNSCLPDPATFEAVLRENNIDGATLLEQVDKETLKNDLGIATLGERAAIVYAVNTLRIHSSKYLSRKIHIETQQTRIQSEAAAAISAQTPPRSDRVPSPAADGAPDAFIKDPQPRRGEYLVTHGGAKRRRLVLEPKSTNTSAERTCGYLGRHPISIDAIFYGDKINGQLLDDDSDNDSTISAMAIPTSPQLNRGDKIFTHRRIQHFLNSNIGTLDKSRSVRHPYPKELAMGKSGPSATLFTVSGDVVYATKKDATLVGLEATELEDGADGGDIDRSWDYLLSKYPSHKEDYVLPLYDELDSDNEESKSLLDEINTDQVQAQSSPANGQQGSGLTTDEVERIINDEITGFRVLWSEDVLPRRQNMAWKEWKKGRGRDRAKTISSAKAAVESLNQRLQKFRKEICGEHWKKAKSLRKQCSALEPTVLDLQDLEWKLRLWDTAQQPPRLSSTRPIQKQTQRKPSSDSGESLGSDPDSMGDFIDVDTIDYEPSHKPQSTADNRQSHQNSPDRRNGWEVAQWVEGQKEAISPARAEQSESEDSVIGPKVNENNASRSLEVVDLTSPAAQDSYYDDSFTQQEDDRVPMSTKEEIAAWDWLSLDEQSDRQRIVQKHLQETVDEKLRRKIRLYIAQNVQRVVKEAVQRGLGALKRKSSATIQDVPSHHAPTVFAISRLFVCWNDGSHRHFKNPIPDHAMKAALLVRGFDTFYNFTKSLSAVANESDSEGLEDPNGPSPRKIRKKKVLKDSEAQALQSMAQARHEKMEVRTLRLKSQADLPQGASDIIVNILKDDNEDTITLNRHIGDRIKPHQIEGLRFLWREIVTVGLSSAMQGCLLAHTMGLGKTMQAISLLVTIAEAAASPSPGVSEQIPVALRQSRTLILCPAGLIENWKEEFQSWVPPDVLLSLGSIFDVSAKDEVKGRLETIHKWHEDGGILIIGYEMFRLLVLNKPVSTRTNQGPPLSRPQHEMVEKQLLHGPNLVVADEAHKLKGERSAIAEVSSRFRTSRRVALTGSPLSNSLIDYYRMINWVAPGYLGDQVEFRATYKEPIEAGIPRDAPEADQRRSLKKLKALVSDIEPKVNRADISVIQGELKPKTEFVITIPLTQWQTEAYTCFVEYVRSSSGGHGSAESKNVQAKLFDYIHFLALLCTQPSIFLEALRERSRKRHLAAEPVEDDTSDGRAEISDSAVAHQAQIVEQLDIDDILDPSFGHKTRIIGDILAHAKDIGDQVLVFSQSLATLDYLEQFIKRLPAEIKTARLDGHTKIEERTKMVKDFNAGVQDVFLISTMAGSLGLNISGANRVILVDFGFTPSNEEQAVGRAYRIGQKKPVFVYHLVTGGTYEATLHNLSIFKTQLAARVVDRKNPMRSASRMETYLFLPKEVEQEENLSEFKGKDVIMDHLLESPTGAYIRGLKTTETMHAETKEELTAEEEAEVREMIKGDQLRKRDPQAWERWREEQQAQALGYPLNPLASSSQSVNARSTGLSLPRPWFSSAAGYTSTGSSAAAALVKAPASTDEAALGT